MLPINSRPGTEHLVLQYDSISGPFFGGPGRVLRYSSPGAAPEVVNDCLTRPTSMAFDENGAVPYITEEGFPPAPGRIVVIAVEP